MQSFSFLIRNFGLIMAGCGIFLMIWPGLKIIYRVWSSIEEEKMLCSYSKADSKQWLFFLLEPRSLSRSSLTFDWYLDVKSPASGAYKPIHSEIWK